MLMYVKPWEYRATNQSGKFLVKLQ